MVDGKRLRTWLRLRLGNGQPTIEYLQLTNKGFANEKSIDIKRI